MGNDFRNREGYPDPTAGAALRRLSQEEHRYRPLVYICSPYADDPVSNKEKAIRYCRFAVDAGRIPLAPHLLLPLYMKEDTERGLALFMDLVFLSKCEELWVFGDRISGGMQAEIDRAKKLGIRTRYFTESDERTQYEDRQ